MRSEPDTEAREDDMFPGFFIGTVCLVLLVRSLVGGPRWFYRHGAHHPWRAGYDGPTVWLWDDDPWPSRRSRHDGREDSHAPRSVDSGAAPFTASSVEDAVGRLVRSLRDRLDATP